MIYPVVLASGGAGETAAQGRGLPAHFAAGPGVESRFQALLRTLSGTFCAAPVVITGNGCRLAATAQANAVRSGAAAGATLLLEPGASKPAAAAAVAAVQFRDQPGALLLITPASHLFANAAVLDRLLLQAIPEAANGRIVALGTPPGSAALGFGVLDCPSPRPGRGPQPAVLRPAGHDLTAAGPGALHNSGLYLLRAGTLLAALKRCAPRILQAAKAALSGARRSCGAVELGAAGWQRARAASFEDAVVSRAGALMALSSGPLPGIHGQWEADRLAPSSAQGATPCGTCEDSARPLPPSGRAGRADALPLVPDAMGSAVDSPPAAVPWPGATAPGNANQPVSRAAAAGGTQAEAATVDLCPAPEPPRPQISAPERMAGVEVLELRPAERLQLPPGTAPGHLAVVQGCALLQLDGRSRLLWEGQSAVVSAHAGMVIENPARAMLYAAMAQLSPRPLSAPHPAPGGPEEGGTVVKLAALAPLPDALRPSPS